MDTAFLVISLIIALVLHEFAHALVGDWLGDDTARRQGRLTLNPLAHIDPYMTVLLPLVLIVTGSPVVFAAARPVPFNPWRVRWGRLGAALIAAAGPGTNLLLAILSSFCLRFLPLGVNEYQLIGIFMTINVTLGIFNLIPFPPLDGSRLLYAVAPPELREVMDRLERTGLVVILLIFFVAYPFIEPILGRITSAIITWLVPGVALP